MPIVSAKVIQRPRRLRYCAHCERRIAGPVLRLYGSADSGDPKYVLWLHPTDECGGRDPKIATARAASPAPPRAPTETAE